MKAIEAKHRAYFYIRRRERNGHPALLAEATSEIQNDGSTRGGDAIANSFAEMTIAVAA